MQRNAAAKFYATLPEAVDDAPHPPFEWEGEQDVTCDVAVDQLPTPTSNRSQAEWLAAHGLDELVDAARAAWQARVNQWQKFRRRFRRMTLER